VHFFPLLLVTTPSTRYTHISPPRHNATHNIPSTTKNKQIQPQHKQGIKKYNKEITIKGRKRNKQIEKGREREKERARA